MRRHALPTLALSLLLLAGCATQPSPESTSPARAPSPTPSTSTAVAQTGSHGPSPTAAVAGLGDPGHPFDATALLQAMPDSRRPGGVPEQLQTEPIAEALANQIWTFDGEPWTAMSIGGSCGPQSCTFETGGTRPGMLGEDLWLFSVTPATGEVEVAQADLHSLPLELGATLDEMVRSELAETRDLLLSSVRWLPPPDAGSFELAYRSGDEEGSCRIDVTVDAVSGEIRDQASTDC